MNLLPKWLRVPEVGDVIRIQKDCEWVTSTYRERLGIVESVSKKTCDVRIPTDYGHQLHTVSRYEVDVV